MDKFYKKLSLYLSKNQNINKEDEELYEYAAKVAVHGIINIVITILIGIFFGMLKECICFLITFFILRKFSGGLHAGKYINCLISSIILLILALFTIKYFEQNSYQILFLAILTFSTIMICVFSPNDNKKKSLSFKEKKIFKCFSVILSVLILLISLFFISKNNILAYSVGTGLISTALLLVLSYIKQFLNDYKYKK
ncbi:accessory gene regulator B family protein [Eubacterium sp.]